MSKLGRNVSLWENRWKFCLKKGKRCEYELGDFILALMLRKSYQHVLMEIQQVDISLKLVFYMWLWFLNHAPMFCVIDICKYLKVCLEFLIFDFFLSYYFSWKEYLKWNIIEKYDVCDIWNYESWILLVMERSHVFALFI